MPQGDQLVDIGGRAVDCLEAALAYLRVTHSGTTEVYTDSTKDAFSDGSWSFGSCNNPESALVSAC